MKEPRTYHTEQLLVSGLQQREQAAFSYLYDHYSAALNGVIYNIIPDSFVATDVLQEVFIKIWRLIDSYDPGKGRLFTWMFNIARSTAIDMARSRGWKNTLRNDSLTEDYAQLPDRSQHPPDLPDLRKIVHTLKAEHKVIIELSYFEGYTQKEIAAMEQIPLGTVKTRLRAALLQLKKRSNFNVDIKAYIESGVIESYVLGVADEAEIAELQRLCLEHPEIAAAVQEREQWLRDMSEATGRPVPDNVKSRLLQSLRPEFAAAPVAPGTVHAINRRFKFIAAASLAALMVSAGGNVYFYKKYSRATQDLLALQQEQLQVLAANRVYQARLTAFDHNLKIISQPGVIKVPLAGVPGKENNLATVYWDAHNKAVYLMVNHLPEAPADKQYQLWALVDGKPVDAGMISDCASLLCSMKQVTGAQAFAITLEKAGGSAAPTLDQLFVMGNVKS